MCLSHNFGLKNVHDGFHFMSVLLFPLKGLSEFLHACPLKYLLACKIMSPLLRKFPIHLSVCVFSTTVCMYLCMCVYMCLWACVYVCVTWGHNSAQDSFIKCGAASEAAVNQFYLLCVGGQLSWHPRTLTPQERTGWILLLQLCCCRLVFKWDLFFYRPTSPEEKDKLPLLSATFSLLWMMRFPASANEFLFSNIFI